MREIAAWQAYEERTAVAYEEHESKGMTYYDVDGRLVRVIHGLWEAESDADKPVLRLPTTVAYRFINILGMSAQELPVEKDPAGERSPGS